MGYGKFCLGATFALVFGGAVAEAAPADRIGSAVAVSNLVTAELARETRTLLTGDPVHQNEIIEVARDGSSELKLNDETKLALGPGARLVLDKFVYDAERTAGPIVLNFAKGAFRFITGVAAKPAYVIRVPMASITVRGTIFDVFVLDSLEAWLLLHEGSVQVCNDRGKCRIHDQPGKLIRITAAGDVGAPTRWTSLPGVQNASFDDAFPFVAQRPGIDTAPIFTREAILLGGPGKPPPSRGTETTPPKRSAGSLPATKQAGRRKTVKIKTRGRDLASSKLPKWKTTESTERRTRVIDAAMALAPSIIGRIKTRSRSVDHSSLNSMPKRTWEPKR